MKNFFIKIALRFVPCAFVAADMNRIHTGTVTVWAYKHATDAAATVAGSGYFDTFTSYLRQGDIIIIAGDLTGTPDTDTAVVSSADNATTVTVAVKT